MYFETYCHHYLHQKLILTTVTALWKKVIQSLPLCGFLSLMTRTPIYLEMELT